ncbi:L-threonylcarbamoyladenylate synthase [Culicoidibacter larvae]|nr:L-threonylcarbamoyladenylate synthase [Culicoidibacter larvae]
MLTRSVESLITELRSGNPVIIPTDTVYGFAASVAQPEAVDAVYHLKQRPAEKALILFGADVEALRPYVAEIPEAVEQLMAHFWPGALTVILPKSTAVPEYVNAGLDTIALRIPQSELVTRIVAETGVLATTSANRSGEAPLPTVALLDSTFPDVMIFDEELAGNGMASTIVEWRDSEFLFHRIGAISKKDIGDVLLRNY